MSDVLQTKGTKNEKNSALKTSHWTKMKADVYTYMYNLMHVKKGKKMLLQKLSLLKIQSTFYNGFCLHFYKYIQCLLSVKSMEQFYVYYSN